MNYPIKWADMPFEMRETILSDAALSPRLAYYEWEELKAWREYIEHAMSKLRITLDEE